MDGPGISLPHLTLQTVIGITVAIAGNVLISFALNLQKLAHLRLDREREKSRQEAERGSRRPGRDNNTRDLIHSDTAHVRASPQPTLESQSFETQPLLSHRSTSQPPATTYSLSQYDISAAMDETRSRKSSNGVRPKRRQRKQTFASRLLPLRMGFGGSHPDYLSHHVDSSDGSAIPVDDLFPRRNTPADRRTDSSWSDDEKESNYLHSKLWWLGFILMNVGETGNFISYGFAPASVVAPLGTFALVANCFFAPLMLRERFRPRDIFGILLAVIGATTVVLAAPSSDSPPPILTPDALLEAIAERQFVVFSTVYLVSAIILCGLSEGAVGRQMVVVDVGLCAIFGGFTVLATKAISTLLTKEGVKMVSEWITYPIAAVLVVTGVLQIRYLNRALKRFDSKIVIPTQFVFFTLSAIIGSAVLYGDFRRATFHEMVTFLYGCAATFGGVFVIARSPNKDSGEIIHDEERREQGGWREEASRIDVNMEAPSHPALGMPRAAAREIPDLRHKRSAMSLVGYTPVQNMLLAHTPPRERGGFWDID